MHAVLGLFFAFCELRLPGAAVQSINFWCTALGEANSHIACNSSVQECFCSLYIQFETTLSKITRDGALQQRPVRKDTLLRYKLKTVIFTVALKCKKWCITDRDKIKIKNNKHFCKEWIYGLIWDPKKHL